MRQLAVLARPSGRALALLVLRLSLVLAAHGGDLASSVPPPRSVAYIVGPVALSSFSHKSGCHCNARCHVLAEHSSKKRGRCAAVCSSVRGRRTLRMMTTGNGNAGREAGAGSEEKLELAAEVCVFMFM